MIEQKDDKDERQRKQSDYVFTMKGKQAIWQKKGQLLLRITISDIK